MSEQLKDAAATIVIQRAGNGWVIAVSGAAGVSTWIAKSPREALQFVSPGLGLTEFPKELSPENEKVERCLLLLGSLHDQMVRHSIYVVSKSEDSRKVLETRATAGVAADIRAALEDLGFTFKDEKPGA